MFFSNLYGGAHFAVTIESKVRDKTLLIVLHGRVIAYPRKAQILQPALPQCLLQAWQQPCLLSEPLFVAGCPASLHRAAMSRPPAAADQIGSLHTLLQD